MKILFDLFLLKKNEPEWLLEWRLKAFRQWQKMTEPKWPNVTYPAYKLSGYYLLLCSQSKK
jgi:Fe-S cluster assembly scaffold protein SufB